VQSQKKKIKHLSTLHEACIQRLLALYRSFHVVVLYLLNTFKVAVKTV